LEGSFLSPLPLPVLQVLNLDRSSYRWLDAEGPDGQEMDTDFICGSEERDGCLYITMVLRWIHAEW